jgi:hypothetical protein
MKFTGRSKTLKYLVTFLLAIATPLAFGADQPSVQVKPPDVHGPRPIADQTAEAAVRDYLESWQAMKSALDQNRASLLNRDFEGEAKDKLTAAISGQIKAGIHTKYEDRSHNIQIVFYSPEGLSIQLVDNVEYDQQVFLNGKLLATQPARARYVVVMTPSQVRWRVRVFQAQPE